MVASIEKSALSDSGLRIIHILQEAGLPGDSTDHEWMATRLVHHAERLGNGKQTNYIADLLVSGLLMDHGIDPGCAKALQGRKFPQESLKAVPVLLKIGCPTSSWQLIDRGLLSFEGKVWGGTERWVLNGQLLKPLSDTWHELGEERMLKNIARGLIPLVHDVDTLPQIKVTGVDRKIGRSWLKQLSSYLDAAADGLVPHLVLSD